MSYRLVLKVKGKVTENIASRPSLSPNAMAEINRIEVKTRSEVDRLSKYLSN